VISESGLEGASPSLSLADICNIIFLLHWWSS
jgi:hypothetical protein